MIKNFNVLFKAPKMDQDFLKKIELCLFSYRRHESIKSNTKISSCGNFNFVEYSDHFHPLKTFEDSYREMHISSCLKFLNKIDLNDCSISNISDYVKNNQNRNFNLNLLCDEIDKNIIKSQTSPIVLDHLMNKDLQSLFEYLLKSQDKIINLKSCSIFFDPSGHKFNQSIQDFMNQLISPEVKDEE